MTFPIVSDTIDSIREQMDSLFFAAVESWHEYHGELTLYIKPDSILSVCRCLHDHPVLQLDMLSDLTAVDHLREMKTGEPRFHVVYHLFSTKTKKRLRLKVPVFEDSPAVDSVTPVWCGANWHERECYDMFGITFRNHPDMRRILMPEEWVGHPLRKDYPVSDQEPYEYIQKQLADE